MKRSDNEILEPYVAQLVKTYHDIQLEFLNAVGRGEIGQKGWKDEENSSAPCILMSAAHTIFVQAIVENNSTETLDKVVDSFVHSLRMHVKDTSDYLEKKKALLRSSSVN
jgi:hypothetical protein